MYRRPITFTDYDGNQVTENFEFNLSKAELVEMEAEYPGGMQAMIQRITKERDGKAIVSVIKDIILRSYGERSLDGRRFVKNEYLRVAKHRSRYRDSLSFAARQGHSAFADDGIISVGLTHDEGMGVCHTCGADDLFMGAAGLCVGYITVYRTLEQEVFLKHDTDLRTQ